MIKKFNANEARLRRHQRMRNHLEGSQERPRLCVFRSGQHIYAQVIDDTTGVTLVAASSIDESLRDFKPAPPLSVERTKEEKAEEEAPVEMAAEVAPTRGRGARAEKPAQKATGKGGQPQKGGSSGKGGKPFTQVKSLLPAAQKSAAKTPVVALAPIAQNRKVATGREVGKLIAQRAKAQGIRPAAIGGGGSAREVR